MLRRAAFALSLLRAARTVCSVNCFACGNPQPADGSKASCFYKIKGSVCRVWQAMARWPCPACCLFLLRKFYWKSMPVRYIWMIVAFALQVAASSSCEETIWSAKPKVLSICPLWRGFDNACLISQRGLTAACVFLPDFFTFLGLEPKPEIIKTSWSLRRPPL